MRVTDVADSLMIAELKAAVDSGFGVSMSIEVFFEHERLRQLATWLTGHLRAGSPTAPTAVPEQRTPAGLEGDLGDTASPEETTTEEPAPVVPAALLRLPTAGPQTVLSVAEMDERAVLPAEITAKSPAEPRDLRTASSLLTGATGFVGAFLLAELLERTTGNVHCLVRAEDRDHARRRLIGNLEAHSLTVRPEWEERIVPVRGDLGEDWLGLGEKAATRLHDEVGHIFHCGAAVKWTYPYKALERANVAGTRETLRLATLGTPLPVHFVSTVGVFSSKDFTDPTVPEDVDLRTSGPLNVGYAQSKWVSEQMVRHAADRGVPVTIHRINSGSHSVTGAFNRADHVNMLLKGCIEAGIAPTAIAMRLQPAPIDYVAAAVVALAGKPEVYGRTFHLVNEESLTWAGLFDAVEEYGHRLKRLEFDEWRAGITGATSGTLALLGLAPFLTGALDDVSMPLFTDEATRAALAGTDITCPRFDATLVHRFLDRFARNGFVTAPDHVNS